MVRTGSNTHSFNPDQRFLSVVFTQSGSKLTITPPPTATWRRRGYYMLFAFDSAGVPSMAKILRLRS